jgi:AcrR family transcriptional regulator
MQALQINLSIDSSLFTKNPESSDLGKNIVRTSIEMIDELGYEAFNFKKLGERIHSNESSIYRYFESKHALLVYLFNWYWSWIEYKLVFLTMNIEQPEVKLLKILRLLTEEVKEDSDFSSINEVLLNKIIISESAKAYHNKEVDEDNKKGFFKVYKRVVQRVCDIILEINPNYPYPHMLISTIIEGAHHQRFFSEHLPALTDVDQGNDAIDRFYKELLLKAIKIEV